ncbi:hypothetical protein BC939DRAFT_446644 [Gamsiella multidivaricata]|uniref:uncharacterized protein n=1 Tax=Gamsiella multidivaricata TaxID=101098 RepID=UPI00221EA0F8|nr:uncharacterized protein BC939DRAFT_446644 [Gamsiella multidivaricata]KAI7826520.1 hypothetical protein BC939DRAFT_446644 [Gamsiella multidivaricata]
MVYCNLRLIWAMLPWDLAGSYSSGLVLYETPTLLKPFILSLFFLFVFSISVRCFSVLSLISFFLIYRAILDAWM